MTLHKIPVVIFTISRSDPIPFCSFCEHTHEHGRRVEVQPMENASLAKGSSFLFCKNGELSDRDCD